MIKIKNTHTWMGRDFFFYPREIYNVAAQPLTIEPNLRRDLISFFNKINGKLLNEILAHIYKISLYLPRRDLISFFNKIDAKLHNETLAHIYNITHRMNETALYI